MHLRQDAGIQFEISRKTLFESNNPNDQTEASEP
jgi:hypothetical protein